MSTLLRRQFVQAALISAVVSSPRLAAAQLATTRTGAADGRKVVLGQSVPLTGAADQIGVAYSAGAKLFFDAFNERNSAGITFELRVLDDAYDPAKAAANATKMLTDKVDALFGFVGTGSADAGAAAAKAEGAVFFAPFAASDALREPAQNHVFHVRPSLADEAHRMVRHCATLGQTRIAVLAEDDAMGRAGLAAVTQALLDLKLPPLVASAFVLAGSDKVDAAVASIAKAQPQAVVQVCLFNTSAAFIRKMRKVSTAVTFMNFSVVGLDPLFIALGKEIGGVVVSQVVPSPRSVTIPIVKEYLSVVDKSDQTASYESLEGFIAAKTFAEAVRRAGKGFDNATLRKTLASMNDYDAGGFRVNLRAGVRDAQRIIDLVTVRPDGRVVR